MYQRETLLKVNLTSWLPSVRAAILGNKYTFSFVEQYKFVLNWLGQSVAVPGVLGGLPYMGHGGTWYRNVSI